MMELTYSRASREDIDVIFALCQELIETYEDTVSVDLPKILTWVRKKIETQILSYTCVWQDGRKVAYYCLSEEADGFELDDFYVLPEYRARGIGTQILGCCLAGLKKPVWLYVFNENHGAIRLYERLGFVNTRQVSPTRQIMTKQP